MTQIINNLNISKKFFKKTLTSKPDNVRIIALAGNPNVGKSTVFNALTGLRQHTGNWPGKTVEGSHGYYEFMNQTFVLVDTPGTYSLMSNSLEEEIARDFVCFGEPDAVIVVLDATCLERNLNLALQITEANKKVVVCLNLIDEASKKGILIDADELSLELGVPVIATNARSGEGLSDLMHEVYKLTNNQKKTYIRNLKYNLELENSVLKIKECLADSLKNNSKITLQNSAKKSYQPPLRWMSLKLLEGDQKIRDSIFKTLCFNKYLINQIESAAKKEQQRLDKLGIKLNSIKDELVTTITKKSEEIFNRCTTIKNKNYDERDRKIDRVLTSKKTGIPLMITLLMLVFWITLIGANYPSELLSAGLFWLQDKLTETFFRLGSPVWLHNLLVLGVYRTLAWVVAVMLPPMAIFFPLFTFLEDVGYLPRVAFNLDNIFKKCGAHGKQALTMCMGFGCNACGVIGSRIIDSPKEKLIAILTNNFVPCNGRFPMLISIITMFFVASFSSPFKSVGSVIILTSVIIFGVLITFLVSKILSSTILKGVPSSFILEMPPYRKPQTGSILVRSIFDRTLFVLMRAVVVAAPAGAIIWAMSSIKAGNTNILNYCTNFLDPFGRLMGLDGVILMAFILGFPANEIVMPIIIMTYMNQGCIMEFENLTSLHNLLASHGWTWITAVCTMLFTLMHYPCGTTMLTIKKETGSLKHTLLAFLVPTLTGIIICLIVANLLKIF